jgi:hypothetical protein
VHEVLVRPGSARDPIEEFLGTLALDGERRAAIRAALGTSIAITIEDVDGIGGLALARGVSFAPGAFEIEWFLVRPRGDVASSARHLLAVTRARLAEHGASSLRFLGGPSQRGGLDLHLLDVAGFERRGRIPDFFGQDEDLVLFTAPVGPSEEPAFDPTNAAALYDAAFGYRDFPAERDFLLACARAHGTRTVRRVASYRCGAGRHLRAFADARIEGVGIDDDPEALELAAKIHGGCRTPVAWISSPIDAPVACRPVDLSFAMLSTCHRLATEAALVAHLEAAADLLAPGGVHVIEATHPGDLLPERGRPVTWTELRGGYAISSRFRLLVEARAQDGTLPASLEVRARDGGHGAVVGTLLQQERWLVPDAAQWRRLVGSVSRFELAAILGDFQLDVAHDQPGAWRAILVMRRVDRAS